MKNSDELPQQDSEIQTLSLAEIASRYGLQQLQFVRQITEGVLSDNVVLTDGQKPLFFKTYNPKYSFEWVKKVHEVKQFFADRDIPVILPIPDKQGDTSFEANGRIHALFPFVEGKQMKSGTLFPVALASAGTMLATIHLAGLHDHPLDVKQKPFTWDEKETITGLEKLLAIASSKPTPDTFDDLAIPHMQQMKATFKKNPQNGEGFGMQNDHMIHGDYSVTNLFFTKNDEVKYVFDWEKTRIGDRRDEIVRFLNLSIFSDGTFNNTDNRFHQASTFLKAYNQHYPITREQLTSAINWYELMTIRGTWLLREHYLAGNTRADRFLPHHIATFQYMSKHLDEFRDRLVSAL